MSLPKASSTDGVSILIVEDSVTQAIKLRHVTEGHGYSVTAARNGKEALAALATEVPTLTITDINMPEMDGYELCRLIKDDPALKDLPVILLTALCDAKDILKGLECGADNFIVKPYDEEFLLSRIQYVLTNMGLRKQADGQEGLEIFFAGHKYRLSTQRIHSIDLLLSTYETAVQKNLELSRAKETLEEQAAQLREKNAEMEADLNMARELQMSFLPERHRSFPAAVPASESALRFFHWYQPTTELGGDFFEIVDLSDTEAGVLICDVMGHGVRAALVTAMIRGLMQELVPIASDPGRLLTSINNSLVSMLRHTVTPLFASAFYLVANVAKGEVRYGNAGHPGPFHVRRNARVIAPLSPETPRPGPVLGMFENHSYQTASANLSAGDAVLLFTDGLYEVEGADGGYLDMKQLRAIIERSMDLPAPELCNRVLAEIREFAVGKQFEDDVCLVGMDVARLDMLLGDRDISRKASAG